MDPAARQDGDRPGERRSDQHPDARRRRLGRAGHLRPPGPADRDWIRRQALAREVRAGDRRLHYIEAGSGPTLLLVHGLGGSGAWWSPLLPALTSAGLRVLAPDLPGFGRSDGPPLAAAAAARLLIGMMDRLSIPRFHLAGHSMGGAAAVALAAEFPGRIDRLVLMNSVGIPDRQVRRVIGQVLRPWRWSSARHFPLMLGDMLRAGPRSLWWSSRQLMDQDVRPLLPRVSAPTLLVWGALDGLIPPEHARRFAAALPDARIELIPDARHLPMVTRPARTAAVLIEFLATPASPR